MKKPEKIMEGRAMAGQKCKGYHEQHICKLAEVDKFDEIKGVVKEPQYICANCGRAANAEENLCNAVDVEMVKYM